jgi:putative transposase
VALGATENAAVVKALLADLVARGLKPDIARLFIVDGAKALSRAVRDTFGDSALIQRCQIHKGRNIIERLDPSLHTSVNKVLRQAWDSPTAEQAERVLKNLARRLDHDAPGVSASILEGLDEMLTVIRLGLPDQLRRSLGCTNAIESLIAVLRQVCRNRQTLARCTNGLAVDGNCNAGGRERLSPFEGPQAASHSEGSAAAPSAITA